MEDFRRAAARFKAKHKTWAVNIIDDMNVIAEKDPRLLRILQEDAEWAADNDAYETIFVTSDVGVLEMMNGELQQASAYCGILIIRADSDRSRGSNNCRIGDLTTSEARKYLDKQRISQQHADKIINSCGTRISTFMSVCNSIKRELK